MKFMALVGTILLLGACSSGDGEAPATAADLARADQTLKSAEAQLQETEIEMKKAMRMLVKTFDKPCDTVRDFNQVSDSKIEITCKYNGELVEYVVDKNTSTVEEK